MQHRGNTQSAAQALQTGASHGCTFGNQQTSLARRRGDAAGGQHHDILLDQRLHEPHVGRIVLDFGIVATNHAHKTAHCASLNGIQQGIERAAKGFKNGLVGESGHDAHGLNGNFHPFGVALHKCLHSHTHDLAGFLAGIFRVEIKMDCTCKARL